ncbi:MULTISPECIES: hypothetical protein [Arenibacter]|uniref:hypothetical protein n=1 Tax=Arenibacter TaxID=178469 RepID=UPI0008567240|nr:MULTISPECIES: hypothetical protein [Arenibacter]GBF22274.1 hypothetical protein C21_04468 [Arenibacter sp. NBRC 103722]
MNLDNETAEKLIKALNGFSKSMNEFNNTHPDGLRLDPETFDIINSLNYNLKNFNQENE